MVMATVEGADTHPLYGAGSSSCALPRGVQAADRSILLYLRINNVRLYTCIYLATVSRSIQRLRYT